MAKLLRIMIADDQPRTRQSLRALLSAGFHPDEIWEAENGEEAFRIVMESSPHLVILDAKMAGLDGIAATMRIRAACPKTRILVLSLYPEYRNSALNAGADAFLTKDEQAERLMHTLKSLIEQAWSAAEAEPDQDC